MKLLAPVHALPDTPPVVGMATLALLCSPIRGADGQWRVWREQVSTGQPVACALPAGTEVGRVLLNGAVLPPDVHTDVLLRPGDELLVIPRWGYVPGFWEIVVYAAVSIAVSLAVTGLTFLLFPPPKPHMQAHPDEPSFSFEGIRTSIGPGGVVPVLYGQSRTGGQLLSASVDQAMTIVDNGGGPQRVEAIATPPTLSMLIGLSEGPIDAILTETMQLNGQPIANFPTVEISTRLGTPDQTPIPAFGETRNTFADGRNLTTVTDGVTYTTTAPVHAFALNIAFQEGLYHLTTQGEKQENVAIVSYRYRESPAGDWSAFSQFEVAAARTSVVRFGIRREALALAAYDIHVVFSHAFQMDDLRSKWAPTLESVTEIQSNTNAFPNTATLGIRAVPTDALQGALPNVTVEGRWKTVRVSTFASTLTWSNNPAWCVMDVLTSGRYGMSIPDSEIDLAAFQVYAQYCDQLIGGEIRHTLNYALDREVRAQVLLLEIMGGSRALLLKSEGVWTPRVTRDETPVQLLTWSAVSNLKLTYLRDPDRTNVMEARFSNEEGDYEQDVVTWPTVDTWPAEVHKASMDLRGVTKPSRIMRALQFELNRRRFENLSLEMDCSLEAVVLQPHDIFRFSHPLPGWGESGRVLDGSSTTNLNLDHPVTFNPALQYHVYVRHEDDTIEVKDVSHPGAVTTSALIIAVGQALGSTPIPRLSHWALGSSVPNEGAVKLFRVVKMQRKSDTTVHIQAIAHNPSIYDEANASPLPVITSLFNPAGPPPPLVSLIATEVTRVQPSGASLRVVNLSWDVAALTAGFAPYGGALMLRRTITISGQAGSAEAGVVDFGAIQDSSDANVNFVPLTRVTGHVLDYDDATALTGATYLYRVIPVSGRGVPNTVGGLDVLIHVAGPTTPNYFPGTVQNLRLKGQAVGDTLFEGRDVHLEWDPVASSALFSATFFVQDYVVEVWAPGQVYLLRRTTVPGRGPGQGLEWSYTLEQNSEDQIRAGQVQARRDLSIYVYARTNTNLQSLTPAIITVYNPPPDMGDMLPETTALFEAALINFNQFAEPRDFHHYEVHLDFDNPPTAIYQDTSIAFRKLFPGNLTAGATYYVSILPWDTFGPGIRSQIASFTPVSLTADKLDTTPPSVPTGLALTTGADIQVDGTVAPWVQASWTANPEADVAGYQVSFRFGTNPVPLVRFAGRTDTSVRLDNVAGNSTVFAKLAAYDRLWNISAFSAEVSLTTGQDAVAPAAPTNLTAVSSLKAVALLWTPPADLDYDFAEVWSSSTNNRATAIIVGRGGFNFVHEGLGASDTRFYWVRAVDTSGNVSAAYFPASATAGISGTAGQIDSTYITSLAADKITAGSITALVRLGTTNITLDGVQTMLNVFDAQATPVTRVQLGRLGPSATEWGLRIFNALGQIMFDATDGGVKAVGITAGAITAGHLRTDTAVITVAAQIANALIGDAHITNLSASKIIAGTINALVSIGVGAGLFLDGPNNNIKIYDAQGTPMLRVVLGNLGTGDYGLQIYNATGLLMWSATSGAQAVGIATAAVETPKIAPNAVTVTVTYATTSTISSTGSEVQVAAISVTGLLANDTVFITMSAIGVAGAANTMTLRLREDNAIDGGIINATSETGAGPSTSMAFQGVFIAPGTIGQKWFVLTIQESVGSGGVAVTDVWMTGIHMKR